MSEIKNMKRKRLHTSTSVRKESSREETYVKEELKINSKKK
jgi:hypothetical protein